MRDKLLTPEFMTALPADLKPLAMDRLSEFMSWVAEDEAHWKAALATHSQKTANSILNFLPVNSLWSMDADVCAWRNA